MEAAVGLCVHLAFYMHTQVLQRHIVTLKSHTTGQKVGCLLVCSCLAMARVVRRCVEGGSAHPHPHVRSRSLGGRSWCPKTR